MEISGAHSVEFMNCSISIDTLANAPVTIRIIPAMGPSPRLFEYATNQHVWNAHAPLPIFRITTFSN